MNILVVGFPRVPSSKYEKLLGYTRRLLTRGDFSHDAQTPLWEVEMPQTSSLETKGLARIFSPNGSTAAVNHLKKRLNGFVFDAHHVLRVLQQVDFFDTVQDLLLWTLDCKRFQVLRNELTLALTEVLSQFFILELISIIVRCVPLIDTVEDGSFFNVEPSVSVASVVPSSNIRVWTWFPAEEQCRLHVLFIEGEDHQPTVEQAKALRQFKEEMRQDWLPIVSGSHPRFCWFE
jgi:hypothetical protein